LAYFSTIISVLCGFLLLASSPSDKRKKIELLSRNAAIQIDHDVKQIVDKFFESDKDVKEPSDIKISVQPEVIDAELDPSLESDPQAEQGTSVKLRAVRVAIDLVGDYPSALAEKLSNSMLNEYQKNGYRVKSSDDPSAPLFTATVVVTPSIDIKLRKWLIGAGFIGAWLALLLIVVATMRMTFFRDAPESAVLPKLPKAAMTSIASDRRKISQVDSNLSPRIALQEPLISLAGDFTPGEIPIHSHLNGPTFDEPNPDRPRPQSIESRKQNADDDALKRVFQAKSFEEVVVELAALKHEDRAKAMELLNLGPEIRDKLALILHQRLTLLR
jgi:hypothetical protein